MKITITFILFWCIQNSYSQTNYSDSLTLERQKHEIEFKKEVLNDEERSHFKGICYFNIDTNLIVEATFKKEKGKKFKMPMSKERVVYYRKYGTITFKINDTVCVLNVYQNLNLLNDKEFQNYLFLPFKDLTSGNTTYGGGRYMDIEKTKSNIWTIDFNLAYHPYCAYSERYSCPIVPKENNIHVLILGGECYYGH
ncbi:MAG: DUF1684 domain-containing protein [Flavobacteriia bacterium]|nr:DUF1684 domain-containing protein [Flavobacteriia bacterium]